MDIVPTRATLLATRIGDLGEWGLTIRCGCRGFPVHIRIEKLAAEYGARHMLEVIVAKMRCERCFRAPGRVEANRGDPFARRPLPAIVLLKSKRTVDRR